MYPPYSYLLVPRLKGFVIQIGNLKYYMSTSN
jgi:hypothetical protein